MLSFHTKVREFRRNLVADRLPAHWVGKACHLWMGFKSFLPVGSMKCGGQQNITVRQFYPVSNRYL